MGNIWYLTTLSVVAVARPVCRLIAWRMWLKANREMQSEEPTAQLADMARVAESFFRPIGGRFLADLGTGRKARQKEVSSPESLE